MIRPLFAVFDHKSKMYSAPFPHVNKMTAMRGMQDQLRNPQDPMRINAGDYELFRIGEFDDETGGLIAQVPAEPIVYLSDLVED